MNKAVSARRLLMVADLLEKLPRKRFDYATWVGEDWKGKPDLSCGTTACALGWACTIPTLKRAGLRLYRNRDDIWFNVRITAPGFRDTINPIFAAEEIFGLDHDEAEYLFVPIETGDPKFIDYSGKVWPRGPGNHATPQTVAKHIRRFVKLKAKQAARALKWKIKDD